MARRFSSRGRFPVGERRKTQWVLGPGGDDPAFDTISSGVSATIIFGTGITPTVPALTLVRLRGMFQIRLQTADASGAGFTYTLGIGIVTSDAFAIGVTAIPDPFDDADWGGWIWHQFGVIKAPSEVLDLNQIPAQTIEIDSKAMRKFSNNETMFAAVQVAEVATATMSAELVTRALVKLP